MAGGATREAELNRLLVKALEIPEDRWRSFLEGTARDVELAREAEALLRGEAGLGDFLEKPIAPASQAEDSESWTAPTSPAAGDSTADSELGPQTVLADRYRIVRLLGKGGMGEVYQVEDLMLGAEVALKLLPRARLEDWQLRQLLSEVRIARQITHANVCRVHDVGEADGRHFLTMELIPGDNLAEMLRRDGQLSVVRAVEIGAEVCDALGAVHQTGILHHDVKPSNVMIDDIGQARLSDFGVAGLAGEAAIGGTLPYMAPELHAGQRATVQSELFALGVLLYELLTSQRPYPSLSLRNLGQGLSEPPPPPLREVRPEVPPTVEQMILRCLAIDPHDRPLSAAVVATALRGGQSLGSLAPEVRLHPSEALEFPDQPYPLLLPYQHPELLAGRNREIEDLRSRLELSVPILTLSASSGVGKSSLLSGGLLPVLRAAGRPTVLERYVAEPGLGGRLLEGLLATPGGLPIADREIDGFVHRLLEVERLAGGASPVLVLDQVEDLFRLPDADRSRAVLGLLLAGTCRRLAGRSMPICHWILAYREEFHGTLTAWLTDVLADASREGLGQDWGNLPRDLSTPDRLQVVPLKPLATAIGSSSDAIGDAADVFLNAIRAPLTLSHRGQRRYPWRFAKGAAERLARAFGEARWAQPDAPLVPEFQVVLAHLLDQAAPPDKQGIRRIDVPEDVHSLIDRALDDHLRRVLAAAFPGVRGAAQGRARALLMLRELAEVARDGSGSIPAARLVQAIGGDGRRILEILAGPGARLVIPSAGDGGEVYRLSHDRIAEAVERLVDMEGRRGELLIDSELLALRRRVGLQSALYRSGEISATAISTTSFRRIARHEAALLWDEERRRWWRACQQRRRADHLKQAFIAVVALLAVVMGGLVLRTAVDRRAQRQATLEQLAWGGPEAAFRTLFGALDEFATQDLRTALRQRPEPFDLLAKGLGGVEPASRATALVRVAELLLPWVDEIPEQSNPRLASLLWALDHSGVEREEAASYLRRRALENLRTLHPPPEDEPGWVRIPSGSFWMGASPEEARLGDDHLNELPRHRVAISGFEMLAHEVTNGEYRRLFPDHPGEENLPAVGMSWYDAAVYAAWLGGRLPTEAEWEYAARSSCETSYCTSDGLAVTLDEVAWWRGNSADTTGMPRLRQVALRQPNQHGLFDIYGNVWEWTADWYGLYSEQDRKDPRGPTVGSPPNRVSRGGSVFDHSEWAHPSGRRSTPPGQANRMTGLRPVRSL